MPELTQNDLKAVLRYDRDSGMFFHTRTISGVKAGDVAGWMTVGDYVCVNVNGQEYRAHRVAWFYVTGEWPKHQIDHINGVRSDNRWNNLRDVPWAVNAQNQRKPTRNNKTGFLGVCESHGRYRAQIRVNGEKVRLGHFDTPEQAHEAYLVAKRKYHEGCTI